MAYAASDIQAMRIDSLGFPTELEQAGKQQPDLPKKFRI
jgi:hypothetical protein